jgi:hypothetical protein
MLNKKNNKAVAGASFRRWRVTLAVLGLLTLLTKHYPLQNPVHVGMFAGSLLQRGDWDH